MLDVNNAAVQAADATLDGPNEYRFDAIHSDCGKVTFEVLSEKDPKIKVLDQRTIETVFDDFVPHRKQLAAGSSQQWPPRRRVVLVSCREIP